MIEIRKHLIPRPIILVFVRLERILFPTTTSNGSQDINTQLTKVVFLERVPTVRQSYRFCFIARS